MTFSYACFNSWSMSTCNFSNIWTCCSFKIIISYSDFIVVNFNSSFSKNWSGKLGFRRNMVNNEDINTSLGLNFKNECIDIDLSLSRRNTTTDLLPKDSRIDLVVNFGNIGSKYYNNKMSKCVIKWWPSSDI